MRSSASVRLVRESVVALAAGLFAAARCAIHKHDLARDSYLIW
jgi:hypothetical protein